MVFSEIQPIFPIGLSTKEGADGIPFVRNPKRPLRPLEPFRILPSVLLLPPRPTQFTSRLVCQWPSLPATQFASHKGSSELEAQLGYL